MDEKETVREAARKRKRLSGVDAQALEGALQQAEKDIEKLTRDLEGGIDPETGIRHQGCRSLVVELKKLCEELEGRC